MTAVSPGLGPGRRLHIVVVDFDGGRQTERLDRRDGLQHSHPVELKVRDRIARLLQSLRGKVVEPPLQFFFPVFGVEAKAGIVLEIRPEASHDGGVGDVASVVLIVPSRRAGGARRGEGWADHDVVGLRGRTTVVFAVISC